MIAEPCSWETLRATFGVSDENVMTVPETPLGRTWLCGRVSSTFAVARHVRLEPWSGVLAISQYAGRGQLGRSWVSPPGNLYATLGLPASGPFAGELAALAAGYLAAQALAEQAVWMKWPNDLIMRRNGVWRKVGGLLVEERDGLVHLGLGLNLASAPDDALMRRERAFPAGTLDQTGSLWTFWNALVQSMHQRYNTLAAYDAPRWIEAILTRMAFVGHEVQVVDPPAEPLSGRFTSLDVAGGLRLQSTNGERVARAGSLRLLPHTTLN